LSQSHNLTDQCKALVESLSLGSQECIICSNPIYQRSAVWNCKQCCQPFHLGCIKRWIRKLNTGKEAEEADDRGEDENNEESKVQQADHDAGRFRLGDEELQEIADDAQENEVR